MVGPSGEEARRAALEREAIPVKSQLTSRKMVPGAEGRGRGFMGRDAAETPSSYGQGLLAGLEIASLGSRSARETAEEVSFMLPELTDHTRLKEQS